jgi:hypothetical protein
MYSIHHDLPDGGDAGRLVAGLIGPEDELFLPLNRRVVARYAVGGDGVRELHLYCGPKEVVFDEPELFDFGETLVKHSSFRAGSTAGWGRGYEWPRVRDLLQQLVIEGVLQHGSGAVAGPRADAGAEATERPSPLAPAPSARARHWDECEAITRELAGRSVEPGYLELVVPVFRVAHISVDADGRQLGEANVIPRALRLEVPTRWRTCTEPGSRFLDPKPMNASALQPMRARWPKLMAALLRIRRSYLDRFPAARSGLTLGDVQRLATLVQAVATYPLVVTNGRVPNGQLHPVLSSLFRAADGLRTTTHQMLLDPLAEATISPDTLVSASEIHAFAERNRSFHSAQGVCPAPAAMIEQFLRVLMEGADDSEFSAEIQDGPVERALGDIEPAFDYGLLGLQAFAVVSSHAPLMARTCARMTQIVEGWGGLRTPALEQLGAYLAEKAGNLQSQTPYATEESRARRERVYADMYAQCARGLGDPVRQSLPERSPGRVGVQHRRAGEILRDILHRRCSAGPDAPADIVDWLADCLMHSFVRSHELLGLASDIQARINALVGRPQPLRPFSALDVDIQVQLQDDGTQRLPNLLEELEQLLGLRVHITGDRVEIHDGIEG